MLRPRAVRALLLEAAGVRVPAAAAAEEESGGSESAGQAAETAGEREALDRARRRALVVAVLDAAAIALLVLLRQSDRFLVLGRDEETLFTLGVLVVAVHLGFRLAQGMTIGTVRRLHDELVERED
ncbi:MAG TPA: hypothetical protein VF100_05230 [Thermoanaerobaculia bacterium]